MQPQLIATTLVSLFAHSTPEATMERGSVARCLIYGQESPGSLLPALTPKWLWPVTDVDVAEALALRNVPVTVFYLTELLASALSLSTMATTNASLRSTRLPWSLWAASVVPPTVLEQTESWTTAYQLVIQRPEKFTIFHTE